MRAASKFPSFIAPLLAMPFLLAACSDPLGGAQVGRALCWENSDAFNISCTEVAPVEPTSTSGKDTSDPVLAPHPTTPITPVTRTPTVSSSASAGDGQTAASQSTETEAAAAAAGDFGANAALSTPTEAAAAAAGDFGANAALSTPTEAAAASADGTGKTSVSYVENGKGYAVSVGEDGPTITEIN